MLDDQGAPPAAEPAPAADSEAAATAEADAPDSTEPPPVADTPPTVRKINGPAAEPVDLAGVAGPAVVKRVLPVVLALLLVVFLLRRRK
jgi:hypothetical protein